MPKKNPRFLLVVSLIVNVVLIIAYAKSHRCETDRVAALEREVEAWMPAAKAFSMERRLASDRTTLARAITPFLAELQESCRTGDSDSCESIAIVENELTDVAKR